MTTATAYPLCWPPNFPRSKSREKGRFSTELHVALNNVKKSLAFFGSDSGKAVSNLVLSSNVTLGVAHPTDPGIAVWFLWDGLQVCIPVDRYLSPESNLQAVHHVLEARRVELRHGTLALVRATMTGFVALPAPAKPWWLVLGVKESASREEIEHAFRRLAREGHPDTGGSNAMMALLNTARAEALKAVSA